MATGNVQMNVGVKKVLAPNTGISKWGKSWPVGTLKVFEGQARVMLPKGWTNYPAQATEIVNLARELGWIADDGILVGRKGLLTVRLYPDGEPFVRVSVSRPPGEIAGDVTLDDCDESCGSLGHEFHVTWNVNRTGRGWKNGSMYHRVSGGQWTDLKSVPFIRHMIESNPVIARSPYINETR